MSGLLSQYHLVLFSLDTLVSVTLLEIESGKDISLQQYSRAMHGSLLANYSATYGTKNDMTKKD
ncbi:hypothetical protein KC19_1G224700 [Ceratodon purpureus]|uniref:Uncharacterized protein n=1 Tax=Ceratodon purpureus TaxID=3225 RepID=A0A8T0J8T0_CERPU|nr:hypothetical protein KC19_1G224700 [Ceratodon purpureus]